MNQLIIRVILHIIMGIIIGSFLGKAISCFYFSKKHAVVQQQKETLDDEMTELMKQLKQVKIR